MNKFYYVDVADDIEDPLICFEIETELNRGELISFLKRKAYQYCKENKISVEPYEDDDYHDYDQFEVELNGIHYWFMIATFIGDRHRNHLFNNLESLFTKIKVVKEQTI
jgi:hypothetical protein